MRTASVVFLGAATSAVGVLTGFASSFTGEYGTPTQKVNVPAEKLLSTALILGGIGLAIGALVSGHQKAEP